MAEQAEQCQQVGQAEASGKVTCIMVCVDRSDNAEKAFDFYLERMHHPDSELLITHATDAKKSKEKIEEVKQKYTKKCEEKGVKFQFLSPLDSGKGIGATICESAKKHNVDAIVCGSRGLGAVKRTFLGSVSDYILHHSQTSTLICPPSG